MFSTSKKNEEVVCGESSIRLSEPGISLTTVTEEVRMMHKEPPPKGCSSVIDSTGSEVHSPASLTSLCKGIVSY